MGTATFFFDPVIVRAVGASLAVILILGALAKLRDLELFRYAVENYRLLPAGLVAPFARAFALLELAAGMLLVVQAAQTVAAWLAFGLLAVATGAVMLSLQRGLDRIECGCGGNGQRISWGLVGRNAVLAAGLVLVGLGELPRPLGTFDYCSVAGIALALLGLYACANQLLANQPLLKEIHS